MGRVNQRARRAHRPRPRPSGGRAPATHLTRQGPSHARGWRARGVDRPAVPHTAAAACSTHRRRFVGDWNTRRRRRPLLWLDCLPRNPPPPPQAPAPPVAPVLLVWVSRGSVRSIERWGDARVTPGHKAQANPNAQNRAGFTRLEVRRRLQHHDPLLMMRCPYASCCCR